MKWKKESDAYHEKNGTLHPPDKAPDTETQNNARRKLKDKEYLEYRIKKIAYVV